ncbi:MAG TPA: hypothetical protein VE442_21380 [Jatrophihabitans sp.]|nr:hypothetical protein [Jatrophihabitans sp.]
MRWSVGVAAEGTRPLSRAEVVELADAVAAHGGIASGIGTRRFGATLLIEAPTEDEAVSRARSLFVDASARAGLPPAPIVEVDAVNEDDELG